MSDCQHTWTIGRKGERGSWCQDCGVKVYDVDERQCKDCAHSSKLIGGTICNRHLMSVTPDMNVTFKISEGSCWTPLPSVREWRTIERALSSAAAWKADTPEYAPKSQTCEPRLGNTPGATGARRIGLKLTGSRDSVRPAELKAHTLAGEWFPVLSWMRLNPTDSPPLAVSSRMRQPTFRGRHLGA